MNTEPAARTAYVGQKAREYDEKRFISSGGRLIADTETSMLMQLFEGVATGSRVLEVGCGTGRLLLFAHASGFRCSGLDASPDMLVETKRKFSELNADVSLHLSEGSNLPFDDGTFDCVYSIRVLNQTESADYACTVIRDMVRVTRPGGRILIEFVNKWRPRIGPAGRKSVRLSPRAVIDTATRDGARLIWMRGLFFLGMTASLRTPDFLKPLVKQLDAFLSRLLPRLCARGYALFEKPGC